MGKLVCPRCNAFTAPVVAEFPVQVQLREYGKFHYGKGTANAIVVDDSRSTSYGIIICQSCDRYFVAELTQSGSWLAVYPLQHKPAAEEIPEVIKSELDEANLCFAVGANIGCLLLCRDRSNSFTATTGGF